LDREPSGLVVLLSRSTWRQGKDATVEPQLQAGADDVVGSFAL
jgi:hypothetical protein